MLSEDEFTKLALQVLVLADQRWFQFNDEINVFPDRLDLFELVRKSSGFYARVLDPWTGRLFFEGTGKTEREAIEHIIERFRTFSQRWEERRQSR
jgi:hypothetical protein